MQGVADDDEGEEPGGGVILWPWLDMQPLFVQLCCMVTLLASPLLLPWLALRQLGGGSARKGA